MKMLHIKSTFPVGHEFYSPDCFISIPHIVSVRLVLQETDEDKENYYKIKICLQEDFQAIESHPTEEVAKERLKSMLLKINHSSHAQFDYDCIDNLKL